MRTMTVLTLLLGLALSLAPAQEKERRKAGTTKMAYGKTKAGAEVEQLTLTNGSGITVKLISYGAAITELWVPDSKGKRADVALGFDDLKGYEQKDNPFFGCVAGRYANRIAGGKFTLDGKEYKLAANNAPNHLHGGEKGFDKKVWKVVDANAKVLSPSKEEIGRGVSFSYTSPDGEEGYPGTLSATVTYLLLNDNSLHIMYRATTDKPTPVNLTNHAYFNLAGHDAGDILGHEVLMAASKYTPTDKTLIPTGKIEPVKDTPYDFTKPATIGSRIDKLKGEPGGYDINYVLDSGGGKLAFAVRVTDPKSGRVMEMLTTEPGVQFYTGNFLDGTVKGKGGVVYKKHAGFCLEAQHFPDSPNQKDFPSTILRPGKTYEQTTVYRFPGK